MTGDLVLRKCIYCDREKRVEEFNNEHIWPDALGGDALSNELWRTTDVCENCNRMSGVFVDGLFIRGWLTSAERAFGAREYLNPTSTLHGSLPINFLGTLNRMPVPKGHVADYWAGPCGANIVHVRPIETEDLWRSYVGGDPRAKKSKAGRAYMALTSAVPFWVAVSLKSFKKHFGRARRFVVNAKLPHEMSSLVETPDRSDLVQADDLKVVDEVIRISRTDGEKLSSTITIRTDASAKLALALGWKLFGQTFTQTDYAKHLRQAFRQPSAEARQMLPVRGTSFANSTAVDTIGPALQWSGAWVLLLKRQAGALSLVIVAPSGKTMSVVVCHDTQLVNTLDNNYDDGVVWVTVPPLGESIGPIGLPVYLAHLQTNQVHDGLAALATKRHNPSHLPSCH